MDTRPRVICGFPGVGKTTLFNTLTAKGFPILDSDSSKFDKNEFPANYIAHIKQALEQGFWVLCSTHTAVRAALRDAGIGYAIAAPYGKHLKDEYLQRYKDRGSPEAFLKLMDEKWDEFHDDVWNDPKGLHIGLGEGEYLDRIAKDINASEEHQHRLYLPLGDWSKPGKEKFLVAKGVRAEFREGMRWGFIFGEIQRQIEAGTFDKFITLSDPIYESIATEFAVYFDIPYLVTSTLSPHAALYQFFRTEGQRVQARKLLGK